MRLSINNFRKVEQADIDIQTIALVAGHNEAGKTSIAQAAAAALTGNAHVLGVTKKDAARLVRDGSKAGSTSISGAQGGVKIVYPAMEVTGKGVAPRASEIACGMKKITTMRKEDAAGIVSDVLNAHPTKQDFLDVATPIAGKGAEKIWGIIEQQGWDAAHQIITEQARDLKAEWKLITNDAWGKNKGESWFPDGFSGDLEASSEEALKAAVDEAKKTLEEAIAQNAVVGEKIRNLLTKKDEYPELAKKKEVLEKAIASQKQQVEQLSEQRAALPNPEANVVQCPHCNGDVAVRFQPTKGAFLEKAEHLDPEVRQKMVKDIGAMDNLLKVGKDELAKLERQLADVMVRGKDSVKAIKELRELGDPKAEDVDAGADDKVQSFRDAVASAEKRLNAFTKWRSASHTHQRILNGLALADEVGPAGLRQRKAGEAVARFNEETLHPLCNAFGIAPVSLDLDMNVLYRTHTYPFLSESAKFRVDTVLQVAIAMLDGSQAVIVDGSDIIVGKDRGGLINMLLYSKIPALLCMSLTKPESAPSLSKVGGTVYWMEKSVARQIEG